MNILSLIGRNKGLFDFDINLFEDKLSHKIIKPELSFYKNTIKKSFNNIFNFSFNKTVVDKIPNGINDFIVKDYFEKFKVIDNEPNEFKSYQVFRNLVNISK